jgi:hypothetical protein
MTFRGPQYLFCGSRLTSDTLILRLLLTGLNSQAREWSEVITIQDNGTLEGLEHEVSMFRHLKHQEVGEWSDPNVVLCFMDRMSMNRGTERLLQRAETEKRPWFVIGNASDRRQSPVEG